MSGLTSIFGNSGDDSDSSNSSDQGSSGNVLGTADSALGLDASNHSEQSSTDDDGSTDSSSSDQALNLDTSTDGLLHSMGNEFGDSDSTDSTN